MPPFAVIMPYERFEAWQRCPELALRVYQATKSWPHEELYGLISQARRAAVSAATNIAEGSAKRGSREFRRYLDVSLGSLAELSYLLRLALELGYLEKSDVDQLLPLRERASQVTWSLYASLRRAE
jgi:four helix bundle protein